MKRPEDEILLRDMVDHARRAVAAVAGKERGDLDVDDLLFSVRQGARNWSEDCAFWASRVPSPVVVTNSWQGRTPSPAHISELFHPERTFMDYFLSTIAAGLARSFPFWSCAHSRPTRRGAAAR